MDNEVMIPKDLIGQIREIMNTARYNVAREVNNEQILAYWNIGRVIIEHEQDNSERAEYGKQTLKQLSRVLTKEFGKGFSRSNLQNMRAFYLAYPNCQTLSGKLSWSHYCELLIISDPDRRSFYEKECERSGWSVREMKRQIATSLFERLLLSDGKANKEKVYELATKGQELAVPEDIVKDPYVFEFLGIPESKPVLESDLEKALVRQIEDFMLELGRGFMFVGTQQRVTLNNTHAINEAINRGRKISFQMTEYDDRKERVLHNSGEVYVFSPYSLVWDGDCYYVVGWSDKYNSMGSHRVDRIYRRPEILKEDIVSPAPEFDINEYINTMFRMYNALRKEVLLEVESGLMDAIVDKFGTDVDVLELHEKVLTYDEAVEALRQYIDAKIKGEDVGENGASDTADPSEAPGCFHIRAKVAVGTVFYNWIFGFGGKVKIVEPEEVAERYRELVREACR